MLFFENLNMSGMNLETFINYIENNPVCKEELHKLTNKQMNILFFINELDKVKYLVEEKKVDITVESNSKSTPMFFKNTEIIEYYHKKGLKIQHKSEDEHNLYSTVSFEAAKKLIELGLKLKGDMISPLFSYPSSMINEETYQKYNLLFEHGYEIKTPVSFYRYIRNPRLFKDLIDKSFHFPEREYPHLFLLALSENKTESINLCMEHLFKTKLQKEKLFQDIINTIDTYNQTGFFLKKISHYLEIDLKNYKIDGVPWYFNYKLDKLAVEYLNDNQIPFDKEKHHSQSILFYKYRFQEIEQIVKNNLNLLIEKDSSGRNFLEMMEEVRLNDFIFFLYEDGSDTLNKIVKEELLFPSFLKGTLNLGKGFRGPISEKFHADLALYQKTLIEKGLESLNITFAENKIKKRI